MKLKNFKDTEVVDAFVKHLNLNGYPKLKIERRPDKEKVKGDKKRDIDAIAGDLAIEHTSIDTVENQTRDSVRFLKVVEELEKELSDKLNFRLEIIFPYNGVKKGQDWNSIRKALKIWISTIAQDLEDGKHPNFKITGVPFELFVFKKTDRKAGLFFSRFSPNDDNFIQRLFEHLSRKVEKLKPYKEKGFTTILLVDSDDIALMNDGIMLDGIRDAFSKSLPKGIDQIWYANTSIPNDVLFYDFTLLVEKKFI